MAGFKMAGAGAGRGRRRRKHAAVAEINVTPFVDVMLILLIVFMVTAPLLTSGVPVDLPQSKANPIKEEDDKPLEVTLRSDGKIFVGDTEVEEARLVPLLMAISENNTDRRVYIRADLELDYGRVMGVLGAINGAGMKKVALISKTSQ